MLDRRRLTGAGALALLMPGAWAGDASRSESNGGIGVSGEGRLLRVIVPYPAGGIADVVARLLGERLGATLGLTTVVDNRGGASGTIGMNTLAKSRPDGHTLALSATSPLTLSPHVQHVPYDPLRDVMPVAQAMYAPIYLLGTAAFTGRSFADALAQAKARPGEINLATSGMGSIGHLMLEHLNRQAGVHFNHIPYKGSSLVLNDAFSGQFQLFTTNPGPVVNDAIAQGKLRVLAVGAPQRVAALPAVPTFKELGFPEANLTSVLGFYAPAGTAPASIQRDHDAINAILADPAVQARVTALGNVVTPMSIDDFTQHLRKEYDANGALVRAVGLRAD